MATRNGRSTVLRIVVVAAVLGAAYLVLALLVGRQVPANASVEGIRIGGMTPQLAAATLKRDLAAAATTPIRLHVGGTGKVLSVDPTAAGLSLDVEATLDGMSGFSLNPVRIWEQLTGGEQRPVLTRVDRSRLAGYVSEQVKAVQTQPKDATVAFADGKVSVTPPVVGVEVQVDQAVGQIGSGYPRVREVTATVVTTEPKVSQAKLDAALTSFANPAMSAPVSLVVAGRTAPLAPAQFAPALSMTADDQGNLVPSVDRGKLTGIVTETVKGFLTQPRDARIVLENGAPKVVPSVDGVAVDVASVPDLVVAAFTSPQRTATLGTTVARPTLTTEGAQALGVKEVIASFDSTFPYNPSRTANLVKAADTINGTFLPPGATFSLNGVLGERTAAKGYQEGYVIENGRLVKGVGGGISQVSTVIYNLAWFAGADLVEHTPHSFYISRYPEGREATVYWPNLDNKFKNTSSYGMLIQMSVSGNQVRGRIWSTKVYDVTAVKGPRTNVRPGKEIVDGSAECVPQPEMTPGFDVTVQRVLSSNGVVVRTENHTTSYQPEDKITCTNPNHKT